MFNIFLLMVTASTPNKNNMFLLHFAKSESPNLFAQICCFSDTREHSSPQSILQSQYLVQGEQGLGRAVLFSSGCHHTQSTVSLVGERSRFTRLGFAEKEEMSFQTGDFDCKLATAWSFGLNSWDGAAQNRLPAGTQEKPCKPSSFHFSSTLNISSVKLSIGFFFINR